MPRSLVAELVQYNAGMCWALSAMITIMPPPDAFASADNIHTVLGQDCGFE